VRGLGVEERAAILVDPDGEARVIGSGAWFIDVSDAKLCVTKPLTFGPCEVAKVAPARTFNLKSWQGEAITYNLSVKGGKVVSTQPGGAIY
jgi:cyanophycinase-like exopeptidase